VGWAARDVQAPRVSCEQHSARSSHRLRGWLRLGAAGADLWCRLREDAAVNIIDDLVKRQVRILVTVPHHTRSAEALWRRYHSAGAQIYGHPAVATRLVDTSGFEPVSGDGTVENLARVHVIDSPPRAEQPIEIPWHRALVFGDSVVETGDGQLRARGRALDSDRRRRWWYEQYLPTLERLADLEPAHVLVTHGKPAVGDGSTALRRALQRDPWQRPKR